MAPRINDLLGNYANDAAADSAITTYGWAKSNGMMYYDSTLGMFKRWSTTLSLWVVEGLQSGYEDLRISAFQPRTSAPVLTAFSATPAAVELESWSFANNGTLRGLDGFTQFPHSWVAGTDAYLHLHMSTTAAVAAAVNVGLFCALMIQKIGDPIASAYIKLLWLKKTVPGAGYGAKTHIMTDAFTIPAANLDPSALIFVHVFRDKDTEYVTDNAGAITEAIDDVLWLHEVDVHYASNRFGTVTPTV